jgi:hypothetical protein
LIACGRWDSGKLVETRPVPCAFFPLGVMLNATGQPSHRASSAHLPLQPPHSFFRSVLSLLSPCCFHVGSSSW